MNRKMIFTIHWLLFTKVTDSAMTYIIFKELPGSTWIDNILLKSFPIPPKGVANVFCNVKIVNIAKIYFIMLSLHKAHLNY